jgi:hypothetical protein
MGRSHTKLHTRRPLESDGNHARPRGTEKTQQEIATTPETGNRKNAREQPTQKQHPHHYYQARITAATRIDMSRLAVESIRVRLRCTAPACVAAPPRGVPARARCEYRLDSWLICTHADVFRARATGFARADNVARAHARYIVPRRAALGYGCKANGIRPV